MAQTIHFQRRLENARPDGDFGWIALVLSAPGWVLPPGLLSRWEHVNGAPVKMLYQGFDDVVDEASFVLGDCRLSEPLPYRVAAVLKALMLLEQWRRMTPVNRLEERFQLHLGQMLSLGDTAAHLMSGLAALIESEDRDSPPADRLRDLAFGLRWGIPVSMQGLRFHLGHVLNRADFAALQEARIETVSQLAALPAEELQSMIAGKRKLARLQGILQTIGKEYDMHYNPATVSRSVLPGGPALMAVPNSIEIDGSYERERYLVKINGFPVRLTGKSFKYFTKLAWSRLHSESGWIYKEDLEIGFNQARYLYRMKNEINSCLRCDWPVIENNRLGYYRLDADPAHVQLNEDCLKNHPDWEVRSLVTDQAREAAN